MIRERFEKALAADGWTRPGWRHPTRPELVDLVWDGSWTLAVAWEGDWEGDISRIRLSGSDREAVTAAVDVLCALGLLRPGHSSISDKGWSAACIAVGAKLDQISGRSLDDDGHETDESRTLAFAADVARRMDGQPETTKPINEGEPQ